MTKTCVHTPYLRCLLGLACLAPLVASCTSTVGDDRPPGGGAPDAQVKDLDPTGNWTLNYMYAAGCGVQASTAMATFTVTLTPNGYAVSAAGVTTTGTLICLPDSCKLSGMFAWASNGSQFQQNANITLDMHNALAGNGTVAIVSATTTCSLEFTAHGTRS